MPNIRTKTAEGAPSADGGSITGYASTWTREPDFYGDVVAKGAFSASIERIEAEGRTLPLLWNHDADDLKSYIGTVTGLAEDDHGLLFTATFDSTPGLHWVTNVTFVQQRTPCRTRDEPNVVNCHCADRARLGTFTEV